ncbi:hypothetical protein CROQUDRAFT_704494 [Cronartium quercuum f. sp. fusiforme G11]|uniref:Uncharacterized protein n=1 Tax=Cronartium quercuum f. sp. fusiforme G11 TaxID=708437 RepID=A0A9P6N5F0_9BASI|nr:hypothetical protein CROQUDRAFT_704494 [Cronartium quercuum f. sp. fusiforme G11]
MEEDLDAVVQDEPEVIKEEPELIQSEPEALNEETLFKHVASEDNPEIAQASTGEGEDEGLTGDLDDLIKELKSEETTTNEPVDIPQRAPRRTPEQTASDRAELEAYRETGMKQMLLLESSQLDQLINHLNFKRDIDNLNSHSKVTDEEILIKIDNECKNLLNLLNKWFNKNLKVETKSVNEKLEEINLIINKSLNKVKTKFIQTALNDLNEFVQNQFKIENDILDQFWFTIDNFATEVQAKLGPGFTWLDGVTYRDWETYHRFRKLSEEIRVRYEAVLLGNAEPSILSRLDHPTFFNELEAFKVAIETLQNDFQKSLEELKHIYVTKLQAQKDPEELKGMTDEEVAKVRRDAIKSSVKNSKAQNTASESIPTHVDDVNSRDKEKKSEKISHNEL